MKASVIFQSSSKEENFRRWLLFIIALSFRIAWGYIFWGGCDLEIWQKINICLADNRSYFLPYFPFVEWFIWLGGILSTYDIFPIHFCYKIFPLLFDALTAVLLYDLTKKLHSPATAFKGALLYTFSPIAICSIALHAQWDSISIFFLLAAFYIRSFYQDSYLKYALYGLLFTLSFLVKPITLLFVCIFFTPYQGLLKELKDFLTPVTLGIASTALWGAFILINFKFNFFNTTPAFIMVIAPIALGIMIYSGILGKKIWKKSSTEFKRYLLFQFAAVGGVVLTLLAYAGVLFLLKINFLQACNTVLRYSNRGTIIFGFPFMSIFNEGIIGALVKNRMLLLLALAPIVYFYYTSRISTFPTLTLLYLFTLAFSGLVQHYLVWPVALLLAGRFYKSLAVYNLIATFVAGMYYLHPYSFAGEAFQNTTGLIPLKNVAFLSPSSFFITDFFLSLFLICANYLLPLLFLGIGLYVFYQSYKVIMPLQEDNLNSAYYKNFFSSPYFLPPLLLTLSGGLIHLFLSSSITPSLIENAFINRAQAYTHVVAMGRYSYNPALAGWLNIGVILVVFTISWSFMCYRKQKDFSNSIQR